MPRQSGPHPRAAARHGGAPPAPRVIEGALRPLPVQTEDGVQPFAAIWVDGQTGMVLGHALVDPRQSSDNGTGEALAALERALETAGAGSGASSLYVPGAPAAGPGSRRPNQPIVVRTDQRLAAIAQLRLARFNVLVEPTDDLPMFSLAFEEMTQSLIAAESDEPFTWQIDQALLPPLFEAAAEYAGHEPWTALLDHPPLAIAMGPRSPLPGLETLYGSVLGADGEVFGIAYYLSLDEYRDALRAGEAMAQESGERELDDREAAVMTEQLRRMGAPVDEIPPALLRRMLQEAADSQMPLASPQQESLVCFFNDEEETDPSYIEWLQERGLIDDDVEAIPVFLRTGREYEPRSPDDQETEALTVALAATNQFLTAHRRALRRHPYTVPPTALQQSAQVSGPHGAYTVTVQWPAPDFDINVD